MLSMCRGQVFDSREGVDVDNVGNLVVEITLFCDDGSEEEVVMDSDPRRSLFSRGQGSRKVDGKSVKGIIMIFS